MKIVKVLQALPFHDQVIEAGGEIYAVGGVVRDELMGRDFKDLDILVRLIEPSTLIDLLKQCGRVDEVGKSFGVIKFKEDGKEEVDIALPRTEKKMVDGEGHKAFEVMVDHKLSIKKDLARRDFTINAIAVISDGLVVDPYNGRTNTLYLLTMVLH